MRDDFCTFILTHGRPDRVHTYKTLLRAGYTGKIYIVIDDEDKTADEYRARFGNKVLQFCKAEIAARIDEGDNFNDRRAIIYARNACWDLARQAGCKYFIQLDDDYTNFAFRFRKDGVPCFIQIHKQLDLVLSAMVDFLSNTPARTIAMAQTGEYIGGFGGGEIKGGGLCRLRRKAMNSFVCDTGKPFEFYGRINEDVNTYTNGSRRGELFFTALQIMLAQLQTQANAGGMSELYIDSGTYIKTFYSIMYAPSCVKVGTLGDWRSPHFRIHHKINWHHTAPKILSEQHKKGE